MIGKLIFKLPEDRVEFKLAQEAGAMCAFIEEFSTKLQRRYKHIEPASEEAYKEYECITKEFNDMLEARGINNLLWE